VESLQQPAQKIATSKTVAGIGVSYDKIINTLQPYFKMEKSTPVNGIPRYIGKTEDGHAVLEIIGSKDDITSASLTVTIPNDDPDLAISNAAMMLVFL